MVRGIYLFRTVPKYAGDRRGLERYKIQHGKLIPKCIFMQIVVSAYIHLRIHLVHFMRDLGFFNIKCVLISEYETGVE